MAIGAGVGFGLVAGMSAVELRLGWVHRLGWFEVVDPKESFGLNLLVLAALQPASPLITRYPATPPASQPISQPTSQPAKHTSPPANEMSGEAAHRRANPNPNPNPNPTPNPNPNPNPYPYP